jgi:hypothetical protein
MAFRTKRTIIAQGHPRGIRSEGVTAAGSAVYPGQAVEMTSTADTYDEVASTAAEYLKKKTLIATELMHRHEGQNVDTVYDAAEWFSFYEPLPGEKVNVLVKAGEDIAIGDVGMVEGGGSGLFVEAAGTEAAYLVEFMEASGGALAANSLCEARILK